MRQSGIELLCDDPRLPVDQSNLVHKAAAGLREELAREGQTVSGVRITLGKAIPMGAGLGGGSADAARTIQGLANLWNIGWPIDRLRDFSARLGSDLPFFFHAPSAVCEGRGELVRPAPRPAVRWCVLVLPEIHMPTPAVYKRFDELDAANRELWTGERCRKPDWAMLAGLGSTALLDALVNDLERPAFDLCPELANLRGDIEQALLRPVRMSGSGSSLFTLFDSETAAQQAASLITSRFGTRAIPTELAPVLRDDLGENPATCVT